MGERLHPVDRILERGVEENVFPGAVLLCAQRGQILLLGRAGSLTRRPGSDPMKTDTIFDLASITKPLGTTLALMKLVDEEAVHLDIPLSGLMPGIDLTDKAGLTIRHILCHSAGFPDWRPFYLDLKGLDKGERKKALRRMILSDPLVYRPGTDCLYSDIGFMILEWIIERITGTTMGEYLDQAFYNPLLLKRTFLMCEARSRGYGPAEFAPTEECPWRGRIIRGRSMTKTPMPLGATPVTQGCSVLQRNAHESSCF